MKIDLLIGDPATVEQSLGANAEWAHRGRCNTNYVDNFRKYNMAGSVKADAIVSSIRYGEADRILHLYTTGLGRVAASSPKGARRPRSWFGARLEPLMQVKVVLHAGRRQPPPSPASRPWTRPGLRTSAFALDAAARACDAVSRLFETDDPHPEVFALLANELTILERAEPAGAASYAANGLAFRLKLLLAAGIVPQRVVRELRRARASGGVLRRGRRSRVWCGRVRGLSAGRGRLRIHGRRARAAARGGARRGRAGTAPGRPRDHRDGRIPRACATRPAAVSESAV